MIDKQISFQQHDRSVTCLTLDKYAPNSFICLWQTYSVVQKKKTIQFVVNTLYKKKIKWLSAKIRSWVHLKIDKGPKNTDQICYFNPFWRNFLFILSSGTVFGDFFLYVLRFLNTFSIHVLIKKLDFKCDGSLHSIFCRFLKTFVNHKIWTLRRFFYKVKLFYMDCIVNKYIFFNLYVHSHLKYTHLIKSSLKYI